VRTQLQYLDVKVLDLPPPVRKSFLTTMPPMAIGTEVFLERPLFHPSGEFSLSHRS
jgi:hypothetical protein